MYSKLGLSFAIKNDFLLSKASLVNKKLFYAHLPMAIKINTQNSLLANRSNSTVFLLLVSFFFFFVPLKKGKLICGDQRRLLSVGFTLPIPFQLIFLSFFYYFTKKQEITDHVNSHITVNENLVSLFFVFILFKPFLLIYSNSETFLDVVEDNFQLTTMNF